MFVIVLDYYGVNEPYCTENLFSPAYTQQSYIWLWSVCKQE